MESLGIYIHIPFCRQKCAYCDFYSLPAPAEKLMDAYVSALIRQIEETFGGVKYQADTVYIGGGTPSVLGGKRIGRLMKALGKAVNISKAAEITLEANPESIDKALMKSAAAEGVNRVSIGVQSCDNHELYRLGRLHTFEKAAQAVDITRKYCTNNISLDLMYGLPGQTMEGWRRSVQEVMALKPAHISCYSLKLEPGTPMHRESPELPDDDRQADMYLWAVQALEAAGYRQYEISNFALHGLYSRHNSRYWDLSPYVGLGCSAHSFWGGKRFSVISDVEKYITGEQIIAETDEEPFFARGGEYIMLMLRTAKGVSEQVMAERFNMNFDPYARRLEKYVRSGHAARDGDVWRLTPKGFLVSNVIIADVLDGCALE